MTGLAFDAHQLVKELTSVGFTEAQAETVTSVVKRTRSAEIEEIATKADLAHLATKADFAELKADTSRWMFTAMGFQIAATLAGVGGLMAILRLAH